MEAPSDREPARRRGRGELSWSERHNQIFLLQQKLLHQKRNVNHVLVRLKCHFHPATQNPRCERSELRTPLSPAGRLSPE